MQEKLNKERELRQARPGWQPFFRLQRSCSVSLAEERPRDERGHHGHGGHGGHGGHARA